MNFFLYENRQGIICKCNHIFSVYVCNIKIFLQIYEGHTEIQGVIPARGPLHDAGGYGAPYGAEGGGGEDGFQQGGSW